MRSTTEYTERHEKAVSVIFYSLFLMKKVKDGFLTLFENNEAKRDIRMMKPQKKISGLLEPYNKRSFCRIRGYTYESEKWFAFYRVYSGGSQRKSAKL